MIMNKEFNGQQSFSFTCFVITTFVMVLAKHGGYKHKFVKQSVEHESIWSAKMLI